MSLWALVIQSDQTHGNWITTQNDAREFSKRISLGVWRSLAASIVCTATDARYKQQLSANTHAFGIPNVYRTCAQWNVIMPQVPLRYIRKTALDCTRIIALLFSIVEFVEEARSSFATMQSNNNNNNNNEKPTRVAKQSKAAKKKMFIADIRLCIGRRAWSLQDVT